MNWELIAGLLTLAVSVGALIAGRGRSPSTIVLAGLLAGAAGWSLTSWEPPRPRSSVGRPLELRDRGEEPTDGYVTSNKCRACHPGEYASWHRSFHRTMTQVVSPSTVLSDFDELQLWFDGRPYELYRRGEEHWVELSDPVGVDQIIVLAQSGRIAEAQALAQQLPRVQRRIVLSTGSHHYQLYWYSSGSGRELYMLPFVWLIEEKSWLPRVSTFLVPPGEVEPRKVWNRDCLPCHATGGQPRYRAADVREGVLAAPDSHLAEAGIACEACHGPAAEHVRAHRNPIERYGAWRSEAQDPYAVQPERVEAVRAAEVCGQCHSVNTSHTFDQWAEALDEGEAFRPGQPLAETRYVVSKDTVSESELFSGWLAENPSALDEWFWPDGEVRVAGREFNGLAASPCYQGGEFSCLSCHSIHNSEPNDQLAAEMDGDGACLQCHQDFIQRIAQHSHHPVDSSGARCMNCHLPHTTYGLLKSVRSHRVSSPSVEAELATGRPNACNLCHLDKPLAWTARKLAEQYGQAVPGMELEKETPRAAELLLAGDAGARALAAWHMGWRPARQASGEGWIAPVLAQALNDPYDAVRFIAARSLRRLPGFETLEYDFLAPPADREQARRRAIAARPTVPGTLPATLFRDDGSLDETVVGSLAARRDDRRVFLVE